MNIKLARTIDHFLGIFICFVLSAVEDLKKHLFCKERTKVSPEKILFLGLSEIGSAILAVPAILKTKERYPDAEIYFWIFKENVDILYLLDFVPKDNIIVMRSRNIFVLLVDAFRSLRKIKKENIDTVIDMELFSRFSSILSYLSGAKTRVGFFKGKAKGPYRGNLHTHKVIYNPSIHISRNFDFLVDSFKFSSKNSSLARQQQEKGAFKLPKIYINEQENEKILYKLQAMNSSINKKSKIVIMHIGFKDKIYIRRWPVERYQELIQRVLQDKNVFVVVVGLGSIERRAELLKHQRCLNLIGKTTIRELLTLFSISQVLISHDSGVVHIASLTDIYIIALFGPETPLLYEPLVENKKIFYKGLTCSPCLSAFNHRNSACKDNKCMQAITVEEIYGIAKKYINTEYNVDKNKKD